MINAARKREAHEPPDTSADTNVDDACHVAERVRSALSAAGVATPRERTSFTVSIGIAARGGGDSDSVAAMVKRADEALYQAKQQCRDRVCVGLLEPHGV